jgi:hypothetical protein
VIGFLVRGAMMNLVAPLSSTPLPWNRATSLSMILEINKEVFDSPNISLAIRKGRFDSVLIQAKITLPMRRFTTLPGSPVKY